MLGSAAVRTAVVLRVALLAALAGSLAITERAEAAPKKTTAKPKLKLARAVKTAGPVAWCSDEVETLPNGLCHVDGGQKDGKRTLVVFLHGAIARDVDWQWTQQRALLRQAKQSKFEAIFARAPLGAGGFVWPGSLAAQQTSEQELIDGWEQARRHLEQRQGKPFDEVFLMGFSSGAYFVSSLALRGRTKFDGYAVFAGGGGWGGQAAADAPKAPVFVGVCANDSQTASHSRAFGGTLAARGFPHRVEEQRVGHMFADAHVAHAVAYLRAAKAK